MKKISKTFEDFIRRIISASRFEISAGALPSAFEGELVHNKDAVFVFFQTINSIYEDWNKYTYNVFISDFIHNEGLSIFSVWLAEVFPFNFEYLEIDCPKGPSTVDALLNLSYTYDQNEWKVIQKCLAEFEISIDAETVAKLLLIESVKAISKILSEILENEYKFFTESVDVEFKDGKLTIIYKGAGRVVK